MRRCVHIAVTLLAVFLLMKPFDCLGSGQFTRKAADCCKKGKCAPSSNADDCCKGTLPGGKQLVASKAPQHGAVVPDFTAAIMPVPFTPSVAIAAIRERPAPPGSPPRSRVNLPLLL